MKRTMRLGLPVLGVAVILVAVLILQPWEEAAAGTIQYRACEAVIDIPAARQKDGVKVVLLVEPGTEPILSIGVLGVSDASIDINFDSAGKIQSLPDVAAADARLRPVLNTLRIEPLDPATAPWPYTGAVQRPPAYQKGGTLRHRVPDPGSGLVVIIMFANMTDGSIVHSLTLANCRSRMERLVVFRRGEEPEVTDLTDGLYPDDQAAFQTFFEEVDIHEPGP